MTRDYQLAAKAPGPLSENHKSEREAFLTHNRRSSIPKSPRKVGNPIPPSNVSTLAFPIAVAPVIETAVERGVPNSGSVCIPAPAQTGPCLLMPTPSYAAIHKTESDSEVARKVKRGRRQGMGWLKPHTRGGPAPARESLMLATPSFVALNASNSAASFASRYSLWPGKRRKGRAGTEVAASATTPVLRDEAGLAVPLSPAGCGQPQGAVADVFSPPSILVFNPEGEPAVGLPKDMLDTLSALEAVAEHVKSLPTPNSTEWPPRAATATEVPVFSGSGEPMEPTSPDVRPIQQTGSCSGKDAWSEKACLASPPLPVSRSFRVMGAWLLGAL